LVNGCVFRENVETEPAEEPVEQTAEQPSERKQEPAETITVKKIPTGTPKVTKIEAAPAGDVFQTGISSWYGADFHGKRTANGEIYDMYKLTAAHKTLPFNSLVDVENLDTGKRVTVRINDRGPFIKDRIIDLSYTAARKLGSDADGIAPVTLRIVKPGSVNAADFNRTTAARLPRETITETDVREKPAETAASATTPEMVTQARYFLQAGAFSEVTNAQKMLKNITYILPDVPFKIQLLEGLYKVRSGNLPTRERAEELKRILLDIDIDAFIKEL
ncbi:MAG: septal ring lytic transglycosylase RlpA family protein, partial [bacterium]|nr:septal ring lytic transglycosylase RlpA family protein [bacterium]